MLTGVHATIAQAVSHPDLQRYYVAIHAPPKRSRPRALTTSTMPPRGTKRKMIDSPAEPAVPDPAIFADDYCERKGLVPADQIGLSQKEKSCHQQAEEAREEYKNFRDDTLERKLDGYPDSAPSSPKATSQQKRSRPNSGSPDNPLTPAQKYSRRLFNNRKSAAASRVYAEVLRRAQVTVLQRSDESKEVAELRAKIGAIEEERDALLAAGHEKDRLLHEERVKNADLTAIIRRDKDTLLSITRSFQECKYLRDAPFDQSEKFPCQMDQRPDDYNRILEDHPASLALSSQEYEIVHNLPGTVPLPLGTNTQQSLATSQLGIDQPNYLQDSQQNQLSQSDSQPQTERHSQPPVSSQPFSASDMLKFSSSNALSQVANENDANDFKTGLTCSQSQTEDPDDHRLLRPLPVNILGASQGLGSQPSQDLPSFKTPLGSENPLVDSMFNNSQESSGKDNAP